MNIIVIIIRSTTYGGVGLLVWMFFAMLFSDAGQGEPGAINTITNRAPCFPSINVFNDLEKISKEAYINKIAYSPEDVNKILSDAGVIWLNKGVDVKVVETNKVYGAKLIHVALIDNPQRLCVVDRNYLHMGLFEYIKWKPKY